jgi:hypothetical protein
MVAMRESAAACAMTWEGKGGCKDERGGRKSGGEVGGSGLRNDLRGRRRVYEKGVSRGA